MSHDFLFDRRFQDFVLAADRDHAKEVRSRGCPCGGKLHAADFDRKPLGLAVPPEWAKRFSFCCATEGCRKRLTPGSLRFLGRKFYVGAIVVLASILYHGLTPARRDRFISTFGVSERTLVRWRKWWTRDFSASRFWRAARGLFATPVAEDHLPGSLLERFEGDDQDRLVATLRFLVPVTGGKGLAVQTF